MADAFLRTDAMVFERVDDSSGNVAGVYRDACLLWLDAAARSRGDEDWVERVRATVADNDGYRHLRDHAAFVGELRANHGRKNGFWSRVETDESTLG